MRRFPVILVCCLLSLVAASCGGDESDGEAASDASALADGSATSVSSGGATTEPPGTGSATTIPYGDFTSEIYADDANWHCRPGKVDDVCSADLAATEIRADGTRAVEPHTPAADAPVDCFYVYPTVDFGAPGNRPLEADINPIEVVSVRGQASRFNEVCRVFAPRYRQMTIQGYSDPNMEEYFDIAYGDVSDAFRHYMANDNDGRGVVLIGHSQGSHHLGRLLQEEFDDDAEMRGRLVSALLLGPTGTVQVPEGEVVGGTFENLPLCTAPTETGCIIAYDSYAATLPPVGEVRGQEEGSVSACTNPADLTGAVAPVSGAYFGKTTDGVETDYEVWRDFYTAKCVVAPNGQQYLEIGVEPAPGDARTEVHIANSRSDSLHLLDATFPLRDLINLVAQQSTAFE